MAGRNEPTGELGASVGHSLRERYVYEPDIRGRDFRPATDPGTAPGGSVTGQNPLLQTSGAWLPGG